MMSKNIVIIGASRGIGKCIVELLAKNSNFKILALSRNIDLMDKSFKKYSNVKCFELDLNSKNVRSKCELIFSNYLNIDILINNAGLLIKKPFLELDRKNLEDSYNVNIISVIETVQAVVPRMKNGHIVNISSIGGFQGSIKFPGLTSYSTSKAALCSFTELFAEEYKETGIKMNCLCLGAVQTEMLEEAFSGYKAPVSAKKMAEYIVEFALNSNQWINGKIIPVSLSNP